MKHARMDFPYKKKTVRNHFVLGSAWILIGIIGVAMNRISWANCFFILLGLGSIALYFHDKKNPYLTIEDGKIRKNNLFGRKLDLNTLQHLKKGKGKIQLTTSEQQMTIRLHFIDETQHFELTKMLNDYLPDAAIIH